ncbi:hypothetical protein GGP41_009106 [Bipolaris sorokiniana]|uniref:Uncharacterized protein n=1 Tax=Cochliobolus sativus TaxID=45130 RepID=A0A8H5ZHE6_COCSA|nr:hypothetical protein GGP41_009106 [Bipolaris sorokiniana]
MAGPDYDGLLCENLIMACRTGADRYCSIRRREEAGASSMSPMKSPFFPFDSSVHGRTGTLFMANARLSPSPSGRGRGRGREERGGVLYLSPPTSQWPSVNSKPTTQASPLNAHHPNPWPGSEVVMQWGMVGGRVLGAAHADMTWQCGASSSSLSPSHVCTGLHWQGGIDGIDVIYRAGQHNVAPSWARDRAGQHTAHNRQGQVEYGSGRSNDGSIQARRHAHGMAGSSPQFTAPLCMPWHASSASPGAHSPQWGGLTGAVEADIAGRGATVAVGSPRA